MSERRERDDLSVRRERTRRAIERSLTALEANAEPNREYQQADPPAWMFLLWCFAVGMAAAIIVWATIWHQWAWQVVR